MGRYVSWYLVEVESLLRDKVREDRLYLTLQEVEDHLGESVEELRLTGMDLDTAEFAAIRRFGRPERIAWEEAQSHPGAAITGRRLAVGAALAGVLAPSIAFFLPPSVFVPVVTIVAVLCAVVFLLGSYLWGRSLALTTGVIVTLAALFSVAVAGVQFVGSDNVLRSEAPTLIREIDRSLESTRAQLAFFKKGQRLFRTEPRPPLWTMTEYLAKEADRQLHQRLRQQDPHLRITGLGPATKYLAPGAANLHTWQTKHVGRSASISFYRVTTQGVSGWAHAAREWQKNGTTASNYLEGNLHRLARQREELQRRLAGTMAREAVLRTPQALSCGLQAYVGLMLLNGLAVLVKRHRTSRSWLRRRLA